MAIPPLALIIAALFEEFGGDATVESEMVNVSTPTYHYHFEPTVLKAVVTTSLYRHLIDLNVVWCCMIVHNTAVTTCICRHSGKVGPPGADSVR